MGIRDLHQYTHQQPKSLTSNLTASLWAAPSPRSPTIPGRPTAKPTRLPGIQSLFLKWQRELVEPGQAAFVSLPSIRHWSPLRLSPSCNKLEDDRISVEKPLKVEETLCTSHTSPDMHYQSNVATKGSATTKTRRPLTIQDLLSADVVLSHATLPSRTIHHRRQCGIMDCHKYALTGGFCIRHGGGKRCSHDGCQTVAQSGGRCKAHGGGSKCKVTGCGNVARRKGFCMAHGGRQQCKVTECGKCAHGGGFCISHGGGKRCSFRLCSKSAQAGGFCYSHGGGKRCSAPECFQAARKGGFCIRHRKASQRATRMED